MKRIPKIPTYERKTGRRLTAPVQALYDAMHDSGLTFAEVERLSGVSDSSIGGWFYRGKQPKVNVYCAVAEALGLELTLVKPDNAEQLRKEQEK